MFICSFGCVKKVLLYSRILLKIVSQLNLTLNSFIEEDINTYYYINGRLQKTYSVNSNPDVLNYPVNVEEKGKSASQLYDMALDKVCLSELLNVDTFIHRWVSSDDIFLTIFSLCIRLEIMFLHKAAKKWWKSMILILSR